METAIRQVRAKGSLRGQCLRALCLCVAAGYLVTTLPLHAEGVRNDARPHGIDHASRNTYRHGDFRRGGYSGYGTYDYDYVAPPVIYAPAPAPGVTLFLPLQFR